ncbi:UvrD-helicase domain-containing protein [Aestuariimicrobium sp. Y1814]|uniref:UvrD-helicase domain-containing protein n=1 Tax=Aestuariimicrobium sp. Y1814 TaxID=3418742 RepID=UPI003DA79278
MSIIPLNPAGAAFHADQQRQQLDIARLDLRVSTLVVEASAGTGKTSAIALLTVRALGEGFCSIDQVMLVTYTIKAAAELRTRVHGELTHAIAALRADEELRPELEASAGRDRAGFLANLVRAAAQFDQATITTTHSFCHTMLVGLGIHVDHDTTDTQVESMDALMAEIADDLFLRDQVLDRPQVGTRAAMGRLVKQVLERERVDLHEQQGSVRSDIARAARQEFERRKRTRQVYGFNDMTHRLAEALATGRPNGNPDSARSILASRYRLVMVDEFQDTDEQQWQLVHDAFHGSALLVLIGDPKQSIYRFRGADVQAYLNAAGDHDRYSLKKNYRSSQQVLAGIDAVVNNAQLGPDIHTPTGNADPQGGLVGAPGQWHHPVEIRLVGTNANLGKYLFHQAVDDLVEQTRELFDNPPDVVLPRSHPRRLRRRDVAVLVRAGWRAELVTRKLVEAGIPAVQAGSGSLFKGEAGRAWADVLDLLLTMNDQALRKAALTPLVGWDLPGLVAADDHAIDDLARTARELSQLWLDKGFAVMSDALYSAFSVHERLLQQTRGAQLLSELLQVAELGHDHALRHRASPEAVRRWLVDLQRPDAPDVDARVGADIDAVQVMTMHKAKGLGFPVVLLPDLFDPTRPPIERDQPRFRHDDTGRALLDVSPSASAGDDEEEFQEELRLAYVAMTRAQVTLRVWWGASRDVHTSALHRLLVNPAPFQAPPKVDSLPPRGQVDAMVKHLAEPRFDPIHVHRVPKEGPAKAAVLVPVQEAPLGAPRTWSRSIDHSWRRTSYSGLTAALHELGPAQAASPSAGGLDEPDLAEVAEPTTTTGALLVSPMAGIPGGAEFGNLVHAILEHVDPHTDDLAATIRAASAPYLAASGPEVDPDQLVDALVKVFHSPLGELTGATLADVRAEDRLAELDFELTMGGPGGVGAVADLAALFSDRSLLASDDPLADYGRALASSPAAEQTLNGFLTGSIDAVLRVGSGAGQRFIVVDYKTNTMPLLPEEELTVQHYHAAAMANAMMAAHYPLQALLYSVALHRMLGWRLPGYLPDQHLGGVGYLFVRGMAGPQTPVLGGMPAGVFTWRPPARFVLAADEILGGRR